MKHIKSYKVFESSVSDVWYTLWNIIEKGQFKFHISQTDPGKVIFLNPEHDEVGPNYNFLFDPSRSADNGCPFHKAYHGTSPEFFEYQLKRKVNTKQGFIIKMQPKSGKLFDVRSVSDDLMQFKDIVESNGYQCKFYKDVKSIGTGFNNKRDIDIENSNPWVFRLAIVIKNQIQ